MRTSASPRRPIPQRGLGHSALAASSYSLVGSPAQTREAYRDLLIFEERLKQNSARLASQRRKYEAFLLSLILSIAVLSYRVFITPSPYTLIQFLTSGLLLIGIVTLILFFATGVYSEKIAYAYKFVPQANRALRYFNIYLNTKKPPRKWSYNPFRLFRQSNSPSPTSASSPSSPLARTSSNTSIRSSRSSTSTSPSSPRSRSPYSTTSRGNAIPLAPLPPASNPRGELIFSSKVSQHYRDGYEKYRSDWEEKRRNKKKNISSSSTAVGTSGAVKQGKSSWFGLTLFGQGSPHSRSNTPISSTSSLEEDDKVHLHSEKLNERIKGESISYATSPSSPSDGLSDASSPSILQEPSFSNKRTRGRDARTRPLLRSGSSSSVSSIASTSSSINSNASSPIPPPAFSRRSSPLRNHTSSTAINNPRSLSDELGYAPSASSNGSSRASTPDLIREDDDEKNAMYYPRSNTARSSSSSSTSIALSTSSIQPFFTASTRDKNYSSARTGTRKNTRSGENNNDEDEDDDELHSPPDMSPDSRLVNLPSVSQTGTGGSQKTFITRGHHRASSFTEFLEDLKEEGLE